MKFLDLWMSLILSFYSKRYYYTAHPLVNVVMTNWCHYDKLITKVDMTPILNKLFSSFPLFWVKTSSTWWLLFHSHGRFGNRGRLSWMEVEYFAYHAKYSPGISEEKDMKKVEIFSEALKIISVLNWQIS